ncbi:MAG: hypothetical protein IKI93_02645 [Clostridia bacterium]|nr:hypothetical protein [Clostridia bacterium]
MPIFGGEVRGYRFDMADQIAGMWEERFGEHILHRFGVFGGIYPQVHVP